MRAAEPLDHLSPAERERIRLRLREGLAARRPVTKMRLLPAIASLGLLLVGGAALAGRLGLIRWPGMDPTPSAQKPKPTQPQQAPRAQTRAPLPAAGDRTPQPEPAPATPEASTVDEAAQLALAGPPEVEVIAPPPPARVRSPRVNAKPRALLREGAAQDPAPVVLARPMKPLFAPALTAPTPAQSFAMVTPLDSRLRAARSTPDNVPDFAPSAQDLLGQAMRRLRHDHDAAGALTILARHAGLFPDSPLAGERTQLEVEALLALGRAPEALTRLDGMDLDNIPRAAERHVVRGELRAKARRWVDAEADFDQALVQVKTASSWHERALWGRAMARSHSGDASGSRADVRLYLQSYPQGLFATQAVRLLADHP
jgi:hypothetical protein